ncbi:hypothetical protein D478_04086 [Brevibacillus agri BAB-2500]|nr:hypothetical protein D478_04086 [Brevibacillus agri BAB-2500]
MQLFLCTLEHRDVPTRKIEHSLAVTKGKAMRERRVFLLDLSHNNSGIARHMVLQKKLHKIAFSKAVG